MERIGFIGLGAMGKPMAKNLMQAGYALFVMSRTRSRTGDLLADGAVWRETPGDIARESDIVITMLPDTPDVRRVFAGAGGLFEGVRPGMLLIDMSTISPVAARELAREAAGHGCDFLDAPVSGGDVGAREGTLSIMAGGTPEAFDRAMPVFRVLGKTILRIGEPGAGQIAKAANQILTSVHIAAVAEALVFARKAGVDPVKVRQALMGGSAYSRCLEIHGQRMLDRNFQPGFRMRLHRKDLEIVLEAGKAYGAALPLATEVCAEMAETIADGQGDMDNASLILLLEKWSAGPER